MNKLIISLIVGIIVYICLSFNNLNSIKEHLKGSDPTKPEKCFYDLELLALHKIFVDSLKVNPDLLKKMKGKILPSVCILDLVINKKNGWDKFLQANARKYDTDEKTALGKYLNDNYATALLYAVQNGLEFLTVPNIIEIEVIDPDTGVKTKQNQTINVMDNFRAIIIKKFEGI